MISKSKMTSIQKRASTIILASLCLASGSIAASEIDASNNFRYAYSADGFNQDRDDVAGSAMALALFDKAGFSDRIVHFHFNTNFGGEPTHADEHRKSVLQTGVLFGIIKAENAEDGFFDIAKEREAAIVHLAKQMSRASQAEPLMMICGGGVQVPYAALKRAIDDGASEEALGSITFLSHGKANENTKRANHSNPEYRVNWDDLKKLSPKPKYIDHTSPLVNGSRTGGVIPDQNSTAWNQSPRSKREGIKPWLWLSEYGEKVEGYGFTGTKGEWLLTRLKAAGAPEIGHNGNAEGDASDAGMVFAIIPGGLTDPNMKEIKEFFMNERENTMKPFDSSFAHTVLFWLKNPENQAERKQFEEALKTFMDTSKYAKTGFIGIPPAASRNVVDGSFTYLLTATFESAEAQEAYQKEDAHEIFINIAQPLWDKVIVYDAIGLKE